MKISVIIPVLNEIECLPATIEAIRRAIPAAEIIAVDAGSTDGSRSWLLQQPDIRLVDSKRGKGPQQNAGAAAATGEVFLFLHADCQLPGDAARQVRTLLSNPVICGGAFFVRFEERRPRSLHILAFLMNWRVRLLRRCFGDQGLFIRRGAFAQIKGFPDWPLFEDYEFVRRVKRAGRFGVIASPLTMSARRFHQNGVWTTVGLVLILQLGFYLGVAPERLKRWFEDIRPHLKSAESEGRCQLRF